MTADISGGETPEEGDLLNTVWQAAFDENGRLFASGIGGGARLYRIDPADGQVKTLMTDGGTDVFGIAGQRLFLFSGKAVTVYDTETLDPVSAEDALLSELSGHEEYGTVNADSGQPLSIAAAPDGGVLYATHAGVFQMKPGGSVVAALVDGQLTSLSDPALLFLGVGMLDEAHLYVATVGGGSKLFCYHFDENVSATPKNELSVYALRDTATLRQMLLSFQKAYPDVYVDLRIGMSGEDGVTAEDAIRTLNTALLSGDGPDILILDGLPKKSYIEKGVLSDIGDLVREIDETDGIFAPALRASTEDDGSIYVLPARFLLPAVDGDADTVSAAGNLKTFADRIEALAAEYPGQTILQDKGGARGMLGELWSFDAARILKEDGGLSEDALSDFLTQVKRLYEVDKHAENAERADFVISGILEDYRLSTLYSDGPLSGTNMIGYGSVNGLSELQLVLSSDAVTGQTYGLFDGDGGGVYLPYLSIGVTADKASETALDFVRCFLGKEANVDESGCFPVNQAAFRELCEKKIAEETNLSIGASTEDGGSYYIEYIRITDAEIAGLEAVLSGITREADTDETIRALVIEQGEKYLLEGQSLSDTVSNILKKAELYYAQ